MAFFKIEKSGCTERKGLLQIRYDLFWDKNDKNYKLTEVPIIPKEGYQGKIGETGAPVDVEDYNKWYKSLPTELVNNPFCCHFVYFEPNVTDEEILFIGEIALDRARKDYPHLGKTKNEPVVWKPQMKASTNVKLISVKAKDFTKVPNAELYSVK